MGVVTTLALGSRSRQGAWKGVVWKCNPEVTFTFSGSVREWAHTLSNGLPFWELKSLWSLKFLKNNLKSQNSLNWKLLYTIGKILRLRCLKWAHMIHLSTYNTSYGQKKGRESKCQFDSQPLKIGNPLNWSSYKWCATYRWKALDKGYNFASNLVTIEGLNKKLWASNFVKSLNFENFGIPDLEVLGKMTFGCQPSWLIIENIIRGKVMVSPKFGPWWVLWLHVCTCFVRAPKVFQLCTN